MESKDIKIWGSIQIYTPFNFEHKKNRNFMKRLHDFNEQEIAIGFYDNEKKQMLCFARPFYTILQRKSTHLCA